MRLQGYGVDTRLSSLHLSLRVFIDIQETIARYTSIEKLHEENFYHRFYLHTIRFCFAESSECQSDLQRFCRLLDFGPGEYQSNKGQQ